MTPPLSSPLPSRRKQSRRQFLCRSTRVAGAAAGLSFVPIALRGAGQAPPANARLTMGLIGRGAMGSGHLRRLVDDPTVQLLAIAEVDRTRREQGQRTANQAYADLASRGQYHGCDAYNDYRDLLARSDIDAVVIASPDHWHALQSIDAVKAGKDVYCEKPVSLNIREGRQLVEAVRRGGRVFQTGTQYRSIPTIRQVCEFVRTGGIGPVKSVFTIWGKYEIPTLGPSYIALDPPLPEEAVPDGLDWDMWVGPAPWRPYHHLYHRNPSPGVVPWVFCDAFGAVAITGYQSHAADIIQNALGMETSGPVEVFHPADSQFPTLTFRYANGTLLHHVDHWDMVKDLYHAVPPTARLAGLFGGIFVGERGWITSMSTGGPIEGEPASLFEEMKLASREVTIGANNHHANWFDCIRDRNQPSSHEEIGHRSAALGHLAMIAYALGRSLRWDPHHEAFLGDAEANRMRARALRAPWRL